MNIIGFSILKHYIQLYIINTSHKWVKGWSVLEREILTELSLFSSMRNRSSQNKLGWPLNSLLERGDPVFNHRFPQKLHGFLWKMRETHIGPGWRYHNSRFKSSQICGLQQVYPGYHNCQCCWTLMDVVFRGLERTLLSPIHLPSSQDWKVKTPFLQFWVSYLVPYINRFCPWRAFMRGSNANKGRLDKCLSS